MNAVRYSLTLVLTVMLAPVPAFELISDAEYRAAVAAGKAPAVMAKGVASPAIIWVAPAIDAPVDAPVDLRLRFDAVGEATVVRESLRIRYGLLRLDITERVAQHAQWDGNTLVAPEAELPSGQHTVYIEIADSRQRRGQASFTFTVR